MFRLRKLRDRVAPVAQQFVNDLKASTAARAAGPRGRGAIRGAALVDASDAASGAKNFSTKGGKDASALYAAGPGGGPSAAADFSSFDGALSAHSSDAAFVGVAETMPMPISRKNQHSELKDTLKVSPDVSPAGSPSATGRASPLDAYMGVAEAVAPVATPPKRVVKRVVKSKIKAKSSLAGSRRSSKTLEMPVELTEALVEAKETPVAAVAAVAEVAAAPVAVSPVAPVAAAAAPVVAANPDAALSALDNDALVEMVIERKVTLRRLEKVVSPARAVEIRRATLGVELLRELPFADYDYNAVAGVHCENVIGYVTVPTGVLGPVQIDGVGRHIPMATTEGCLVASAQRGATAMNAAGGVRTHVWRDGMTRAPVVAFDTAAEAVQMATWLETPEAFAECAAAFSSTTRFGKLQSVTPHIAGRTVHMRCVATTGDAMGMNMISLGCERIIRDVILRRFPTSRVLALSGNACTDKKPAAMNWINGRGKSVVAECTIPGDVVKSVLKTTVKQLVELNVAKNLVGSAVAGSVGGNNAHAANIVAAVYIACGQDPAQVVGSSNALSLMEAGVDADGNEVLHFSITMPSMEVGTIGGGTRLAAQRTMLRLMGIDGKPAAPGDDAKLFARCVAAAVMAGELSLMAALSSGDLVKAHMELNRKK